MTAGCKKCLSNKHLRGAKCSHLYALDTRRCVYNMAPFLCTINVCTWFCVNLSCLYCGVAVIGYVKIIV
jgi:hypothetical protein